MLRHKICSAPHSKCLKMIARITLGDKTWTVDNNNVRCIDERHEVTCLENIRAIMNVSGPPTQTQMMIKFVTTNPRLLNLILTRLCLDPTHEFSSTRSLIRVRRLFGGSS